jgi:energy-coupling factor transport system ATP-binding protein
MNIALEQVTFSYSNRYQTPVPVLNGFSLRIAGGECIGVVGPEGAGKSTVLQILDALHRPDAGKLVVDGKDLWSSGRPLSEFRRKVGFAFQFPEQQFLRETVREELVYSSERFGVQDRLDPAAALAAFGLDYEAIEGRSPFLLSMGEARKVALGTLLVHRPELLLIDEPTSGLDGPGVAQVIRALQRLHAEGRTLVIVSHDVDVLAEIASRVVIVSRGSVVHDGEVRSVLGDGRLLGEFGFPVPGSIQALHSLGVEPPDGGLLPVKVEEAREMLSRRKGLKGRPSMSR